MGSTAGQMGRSGGGFTDRKIPGFSSHFAKKKTGIMAKGLSSKTRAEFIRGPRDAKGSKGDGFNGGY